MRRVLLPTVLAAAMTFSLVSRAEPRNRAVLVFDSSVEVIDVESGQLLHRVPFDGERMEWSRRLASAGNFALVEFDFFHKPDETWSRKLVLLDGDGNLLWTREMARGIRASREIFVNEDGLASFDSPEGGLIVDRQGKVLWTGVGYPLGPVMDDFLPLREWSPEDSQPPRSPQYWLHVPPPNYTTRDLTFKRAKRGAFVRDNELVFGDGAFWFRRLGLWPPQPIGFRLLKRVPLPPKCKDPRLDDTTWPRFWSLRCSFEPKIGPREIHYRVDLEKMTWRALTKMPPGWRDRRAFELRERIVERLLAVLGPDGRWYRSTRKDLKGLLWQSADGAHWRQVGEMPAPCGAPSIGRPLCGHLLAWPVTSGNLCGSSGFSRTPSILGSDGVFRPSAYLPGVDHPAAIKEDECSQEGDRFLEYAYSLDAATLSVTDATLSVTELTTGQRRLLRRFDKAERPFRKVLWLTVPDATGIAPIPWTGSDRPQWRQTGE